jgi:CBS domain containing-hemolysin-like protein
MNPGYLEILIIFLLILTNGLLAMSEIAVVSRARCACSTAPKKGSAAPLLRWN